jgi:hypothetical protein
MRATVVRPPPAKHLWRSRPRAVPSDLGHVSRMCSETAMGRFGLSELRCQSSASTIQRGTRRVAKSTESRGWETLLSRGALA